MDVGLTYNLAKMKNKNRKLLTVFQFFWHHCSARFFGIWEQNVRSQNNFEIPKQTNRTYISVYKVHILCVVGLKNFSVDLTNFFLRTSADLKNYSMDFCGPLRTLTIFLVDLCGPYKLFYGLLRTLKIVPRTSADLTNHSADFCGP